VCNRLDKVSPGTTVCGSWAEPSTNVQDRLDDAIQRWSDARDKIESLEAEIKALRYLMSHVPSRVLIEAKENAGCPTLIVPAGGKTCDTCDGSGRVVETTTHIVDRGTKWQRSSDEQVGVECPSCGGDGQSR